MTPKFATKGKREEEHVRGLRKTGLLKKSKSVHILSAGSSHMAAPRCLELRNQVSGEPRGNMKCFRGTHNTSQIMSTVVEIVFVKRLGRCT